MTPFSLSNHSKLEQEDCTRTFSQNEVRTSVFQFTKCKSQSERTSSQKPQDPGSTRTQYPQVPNISFVPCPTLPNTIPTHITQNETQRVATKPDFHQQFGSAWSIKKFGKFPTLHLVQIAAAETATTQRLQWGEKKFTCKGSTSP